MTYAQEQFFKASHINPQGDIVLSWRNLVDQKVAQEDAKLWAGRNIKDIRFFVEEDKPRHFSLRKAVIGILP